VRNNDGGYTALPKSRAAPFCDEPPKLSTKLANEVYVPVAAPPVAPLKRAAGAEGYCTPGIVWRGLRRNLPQKVTANAECMIAANVSDRVLNLIVIGDPALREGGRNTQRRDRGNDDVGQCARRAARVSDREAKVKAVISQPQFIGYPGPKDVRFGYLEVIQVVSEVSVEAGESCHTAFGRPLSIR